MAELEVARAAQVVRERNSITDDVRRRIPNTAVRGEEARPN
jgi:hypothetical protein